jgi:hypothetical protein
MHQYIFSTLQTVFPHPSTQLKLEMVQKKQSNKRVNKCLINNWYFSWHYDLAYSVAAFMYLTHSMVGKIVYNHSIVLSLS